MTDFPEGPTIEVPVPFSALVEVGAVIEGHQAVFRHTAAGASGQPLRMQLGDHDLGMWRIDSFEARRGHYDGPVEYIFTLSRMTKPGEG